MDDIRQLQALRPEIAPEPEIVDRHRDQLRRSMRAIGDDAPRVGAAAVDSPTAPAVELVAASGLDAPNHPATRRRWPAIAAAAAVVAALVGGLAVVRSDDDDAVVDVGTVPSTTDAAIAASTTPTTAASSPGAYLCGEALPAVVHPPADLGEPIEAAAPQSADAAGAGQRVIHWTDGSRTVEVRWPAGSVLLDGGPVPTRGGAGITVATIDVPATATGAITKVAVISGFDAAPDACRTLQVSTFAVEGAALPPIEDIIGLTEDQPLVVDTVVAESAPDVGQCQGPPDLAGPNKQGPVTGGTIHGSPEEALAAFFAGEGTLPATIDRGTLPQGGYTQFRLADGTVGFAWESAPPGFYSVLISVVPAGDGWSVTAIETSGC
jgi:hypothetical protein